MRNLDDYPAAKLCNQLEIELNEAKKDVARMEFLINHAGGVVINLDDNFMNREEIDRAMEEQNNEK